MSLYQIQYINIAIYAKKNFDNYIRHINSKIHKDNTTKYNNKFNDIKNVFKRINFFWQNKKDNESDKNKENKNDTKIIDREGLENNNIKLDVFSQFNQNIREGCKAKKKLLIGNNSQLSTAQSFPVIPLKKRKKKDIQFAVDKTKEKRNKSNKTINEFLINGEYVYKKKINRDNIDFYNNIYFLMN